MNYAKSESFIHKSYSRGGERHGAGRKSDPNPEEKQRITVFKRFSGILKELNAKFKKQGNDDIRGITEDSRGTDREKK
jgi:hypothetical protein